MPPSCSPLPRARLACGYLAAWDSPPGGVQPLPPLCSGLGLLGLRPTPLSCPLPGPGPRHVSASYMPVACPLPLPPMTARPPSLPDIGVAGAALVTGAWLGPGRALTRGSSLPHSQRKQARELLAALQRVVVPIYCTSFLAVEEDKQQKIARVRGALGWGREGVPGTPPPDHAPAPHSCCSSGRRTATSTTPSSSSYRAQRWGWGSTR